MENLGERKETKALYSIIQGLQYEIVEVKENIKNNISKNIDTGDLDELKELQSLIKTVLKIEELVNAVMDNKELDMDRHLIEREILDDRIYTLNDNLTNKKPRSFEFLHEVKFVDSWRSFVEELCLELAKEQPFKYLETVGNRMLNGSHSQYFSFNLGEMNKPLTIELNDKIVYIDVAKLTSNGFLFTKKLVRFFGYDTGKVFISIDPTFSRKIRNA